jgi:hypothetical protein
MHEARYECAFLYMLRAETTRVVSREVVEFGFAGLGVAIMTETAIV